MGSITKSKFSGGGGGKAGGKVTVSRFNGTVKTPEQQRAWWQKALASGPVGMVFDTLSRPAYMVGDLIAGKPLEAANEIIPALPGERARIMPGQALADRGWIPDNGALKFVADVALDPTTYVTFGATGVARRAAMSAAEHAAAAGIETAVKGGRAPLQAVAGAHAGLAVAKSRAPARAITVGVKVPFTRGKGIPLAESRTLGRVVDRAGAAAGSSTIGRQARELFAPHGAADKGIHDVYQAVRRAGETEKAAISRDAKRLERELRAAEKDLGFTPGAGAEAITRHLDDPKTNPLPPELAGFARRAQGILDDFHRAEQGAGIDKRLVDTYVPHLAADAVERDKYQRLFPRGPSEPFFVKPRDLQRLADWDTHGIRPETSIARLVEVRGHASVDERVRKAFDDAVGAGFGRPKDADHARALVGWMDAPGKYMEGRQLPQQVGEAVNRVHQRITPNVTADGLDATRRFIGKTTASWKALALLSPGYHLRNMQSDLMAAYWMGARNPASFVKAAQVLAGRGGETIRVGQRRFSRDELLRLAEAHGVIRAGFARHEVERGIDAYQTGLKAINTPGRGRLARGSQNIGQAREDMVRLGAFIERLKAGDSSITAAGKVRDYLFDYGEVGRFVESARRFWLPFVTYPSKAVPMVASHFARNPGTAANLAKLQSTLNEREGVDTNLLPVGNRLSFALPLPSGVKQAIGAPTDQPLLYNPEQTLPYGSAQLADPTQIGHYLGGLVTPFVKTPVEVGTNHSFYTGHDFPKRSKAPAQIVGLHALGVPIPGYGPKPDLFTGEQVPGYSPKLDAVLRMWPAYSQAGQLIPGGGTDSARLQRVRFGSGLSLSPYDRARQVYYANRFGGR